MIRKCRHSVYIGCDDSTALYCTGCTPGGPYDTVAVEVDAVKWEMVLRKAHLGMLGGHGYIIDEALPILLEGKGLIGLQTPNQVRTTNVEVPHADGRVKRLPSIQPPKWVQVSALLKRLDTISGDIVRARILDELSISDISIQVGLCERQVITRFDAAIELMRKPEAEDYASTRHCLTCNVEFPIQKKGKPRTYCIQCQNKKAHDLYRAKVKARQRLVLNQVWSLQPIKHPHVIGKALALMAA